MNKQLKPGSEQPTKQEDKTGDTKARARQNGFAVIELLFAASTLATTVLVAAMHSSKKPPLYGD